MDADFPAGMMHSIEKFFESEATRPPGLDVYPEVFRTDLFFPLQRPAELVRMMQVARTVSPFTVIEIGADKGGSLYHWIKCHPTVRRAIACEIRGTPYSRLFERQFPDVEFCWVEGSSYSVASAEKVRRFLGGDKIDCLFIDGDKSAFDVDFDTYCMSVARGGVVFMHDVNEPGNSRDTFNCLRRDHRCEEILDISDSVASMARQDMGVPPANAHEAWLRHWNGRSCGVGVVYL